MPKGKKENFIEEEKVEIPQQDKSREEEYFFPDKRITIKAVSLEEAQRKLKDIK